MQSLPILGNASVREPGLRSILLSRPWRSGYRACGAAEGHCCFLRRPYARVLTRPGAGYGSRRRRSNVVIAYGWSETLQQQFQTHAACGFVPRRVIVQQRGLYVLATSASEVAARLSGRFAYGRRPACIRSPATGCSVMARPRRPSSMCCHTVASSYAKRREVAARPRSSPPMSRSPCPRVGTRNPCKR